MKRLASLVLCLILSLTITGCFNIHSELESLQETLAEIDRYYEEILDDVQQPTGIDTKEEAGEKNPEEKKNDDNGFRRNNDDGLYELDMSSSEAFIKDVKKAYNITLIDSYNVLSGLDGEYLKSELNHGLSLFSPRFIKKLVSIYSEYDASFIIELGGVNIHEYGCTEWDRDLTITLYYNVVPSENGITAAVLAHEMGHAVHFILEEAIGESRSEKDLREFNGEFDYVGYSYVYEWDKGTHSFVFAYNYGMYDYYEDIATIFELLAEKPDEMFGRLSNYRYEVLFLKTSYIRDMTYLHISDECSAIFAPLSSAESYWEQAAA